MSGRINLDNMSDEFKSYIQGLGSQLEHIENKNYVTPEDFGAIGDGVADDSDAIKKFLECENGFLVFADCGVNPNPTAEELAEIAIVSSETAKSLCGMTPRVALLSYSTHSGDEMKDPNVVKIKEALKIVKEKSPDLIIDGEIQTDAALVPEVAEIKCPNSVLKGKANVLIFPDLNAGNIAYKLVQRLAGVHAVGPVLQGLKKPVNDLSRGTNADEIVLCMAITIIQTL